MDDKEIPFNDWSKERIREGRKFCTSRHKMYHSDDRVELITHKIRWGLIRKYFWKTEGANSPKELQEVIEQIYKREVPDDELFFVHFGDFREKLSVIGDDKDDTL